MNSQNLARTVEQDFKIPICAIYHASLIMFPDGIIIIPRPH